MRQCECGNFCTENRTNDELRNRMSCLGNPSLTKPCPCSSHLGGADAARERARLKNLPRILDALKKLDL
jgi:hypothetical protein